jgi:hypothetical protein
MLSRGGSTRCYKKLNSAGKLIQSRIATRPTKLNRSLKVITDELAVTRPEAHVSCFRVGGDWAQIQHVRVISKIMSETLSTYDL